MCSLRKLELGSFFYYLCKYILIYLRTLVYMRPEVNSNRFQISLRDEISLRCKVNANKRSHEFMRSETHFGANFKLQRDFHVNSKCS